MISIITISKLPAHDLNNYNTGLFTLGTVHQDLAYTIGLRSNKGVNPIFPTVQSSVFQLN
jgi:hypothetical protein